MFYSGRVAAVHLPDKSHHVSAVSRPLCGNVLEVALGFIYFLSLDSFFALVMEIEFPIGCGNVIAW